MRDKVKICGCELLSKTRATFRSPFIIYSCSPYALRRYPIKNIIPINYRRSINPADAGLQKQCDINRSRQSSKREEPSLAPDCITQIDQESLARSLACTLNFNSAQFRDEKEAFRNFSSTREFLLRIHLRAAIT